MGPRTARDRFKNLILKFRSDEFKSAKKTGSNEVYAELMQLLTEVNQIMLDKERFVCEESDTKKKMAQAAKNIRENAMKTMKEKRKGDEIELLSNLSSPDRPSTRRSSQKE